MYSEISDLKNILPLQTLTELTCDIGPYDTVNSVIAETAINQADREIDAYIGQRYPVPLETVPGLIKTVSAKMAIFFLHVRKNIWSDVWERRYDHCLKILDDIYQGKKSLGPETGDDPPEKQKTPRISTMTRKRRYTREFWEAF
ncbi:MAG: DUF1320 domain-containing protein [Desulfobacteraceae bacterium]|nr:DUF1320 domain-containing protein [Desulfobacteraceae bacterium]